ncbi:phage major tail tube protein [Lachnospiraceae bacterium M18-1]|nr:phage major tail tube protein [Lachnospiraceae bacterium M18-1]
MARVDEVISNFAVYEDAVEFLGMSEATLPEVENVAEEMSGSGIGGKLESIVLGHVEAMTLTLNFRTVTAAAIKLAEPRIHRIDLRAAQQEQNTRTGIIETRSVKHILRVKPKKFSPGKLAAASAADASGEYAVYYYAIHIDGVKKIEIDPLNFIYIINGIDYMKDIRKALGK